MAGERFLELAVASIKAFVAAGLQTELTAIETERSYTAGELAAPVAYVQARMPNDNRSPLFQVYAAGAENEGPARLRHWSIDCTCAITFQGDADRERSERLMYGYLGALERLFNDGTYTLGGRVEAAWPSDVEIAESIGDESATRYALSMGITVRVRETA